MTKYDVDRLSRGTVEAIESTRALRRRLAYSRVLKGSLTRTFPDRSKRGSPGRGRPLTRLHPSLPAISRRERQRLAKKYGLIELAVFGSAVRSDFRPDSDVDVLVRLRKGAPLNVRVLAGLREDLERLLGRRVDVLEESSVIEELRPAMERDRVTVYGRPHEKRVSP